MKTLGMMPYIKELKHSMLQLMVDRKGGLPPALLSLVYTYSLIGNQLIGAGSGWTVVDEDFVIVFG
ncbi:hypothetical protein GCM10028825_38330 [Spirosoma agri]